MYWQMKSKYYSIIALLIIKFFLLLYRSVPWKIHQINVKLSWTLIRTKNEIYPATTRARVARVVGWARVKHRVAASPCFHSHSVLFERLFTHSSEVYLIEHSQLKNCLHWEKKTWLSSVRKGVVHVRRRKLKMDITVSSLDMNHSCPERTQ